MTVKAVELVAVPAVVVTVTGPVVAPAGTLATTFLVPVRHDGGWGPVEGDCAGPRQVDAGNRHLGSRPDPRRA